MKPLVNLAREPFRNRRIFWLSVLAIFGFTSWFGLQAMSEKLTLDRQLLTEEEKLRKLELQLGQVKEKPKDPLTGKEAATTQVTITPEENKELIAASDLIERRAFSWSQLLNDIERHIPRNVRVLRVAVNKINARQESRKANGGAKENDHTISLTMEVIGKSTTDVTMMITDFERTGIFTMTPREKKIMEGTEEVSFILDVEYRPPHPVEGFRTNPNTIAEKRS
jgi:hypothetical protein